MNTQDHLANPSAAAIRARNPLMTTPETFDVTHAADPTDTGTDSGLFVSLDTTTMLGKLWSAMAGAANVLIPDHAATDGVYGLHDADPAVNQGAAQVYFDEDATAGERFLHASATTPFDLYVPTATGRLLLIKYDASAPGVGAATPAVYCNDDGGAGGACGLVFLSPTATSGSDVTSSTRSLLAATE